MQFKKRHKELFAKLTAISLITASIIFMNSGAALAASPTLMKDILSNEIASATGVTHTLSMTIPTAISPANTGTLIITFTGFSAMTTGGAVTCVAGGTASAVWSAGNVLTLTSGSTACAAGALTFTSFTGTNPSSGSNTVTVATGVGTSGISGSFAIPIVSDDTVSVSASISPSITFNVGSQTSGTACSGSYSGNGGVVALGTLTTSAVATSDTSVYNICSRLTTNSASGAVVTVQSLNSGLKSGTDTIASTTATLTAGTSGYGICDSTIGGSDSGVDSTTPTGSTPVATAPFSSACTTSAHNVGGLNGTAQSIWSVAHASQNAYWKILVKAAISGTVPAHSDYADTLTFIATGTF